ncbi:ATP-binding cassette domain-containing protein [Lagierella sp.]|uniref:ABC transporter ATP-binding protein n=1 Tax=Lagierella sp. TaxID=2849657 RepID=UPI002603E83F|nr:ATP-binding cassette domain-containing protein [Lagierella sp.]
MNENIIETYDLSKRFKSKKALDNISLNIKRGAVTGLFGENGAGKTTLMKLVTNQLKPDNGQIVINDKPLVFNSEVNSSIGCLLEKPSLYPYLTASQHLSLFNLLNSENQDHFINELIEEYGLSDFKDTKAKGYSLGMKQRLGLAMAELLGSEILILDEPFNGLDPVSVNKFRDRILHLKSKGITILISSHLIRELEDLIDNLVIISKGKLISSISLKDFMKDKQNSLEKEILKIMEV